MNNYKKGDAVKWIVVFIAIILLAVFLTASITQGFTNVNPWGWFGEDEQAEAETPDVMDENGNDLTAGEVYAMPKMISFSEKALLKAAASGSGISVKINATVEPATATNKAVDWSVAWADTSNTAVVSEYVTAIPDADGSTTATVTCYQAFTDYIVLTVVTRDGGFSASCMVSFEGRPSSLTISEPISGSYQHFPLTALYSLGTSGTYEFPITLSNELGVVGANFRDCAVQVLGFGMVTVQNADQMRGNVVSWIGEPRDVSLDLIKDRIISCSYADGKLIVRIKRAILGSYDRFESDGTSASSGIAYDRVKAIDVGGESNGFTITVFGSNGVSAQIVVTLSDTIVTGVSLAEDIAF